MSAVDHAHAAGQLERWAVDNLRRLAQPGGAPVATAGPMAQAATAQASLAVAHRLAALTDVLRGPAGAAADGPAVSSRGLPVHWSVSSQDGTTPYPDEPDITIPAGVYLIGSDSDDRMDFEDQRVVLRAQHASLDPHVVAPDADTTAAVLRVLADVLNGCAR